MLELLRKNRTYLLSRFWISLEPSNGSVASSVPEAARKMAEDLLRGVVGLEVEDDGIGASSDPS